MTFPSIGSPASKAKRTASRFFALSAPTAFPSLTWPPSTLITRASIESPSETVKFPSPSRKSALVIRPSALPPISTKIASWEKPTTLASTMRPGRIPPVERFGWVLDCFSASANNSAKDSSSSGNWGAALGPSSSLAGSAVPAVAPLVGSSAGGATSLAGSAACAGAAAGSGDAASAFTSATGFAVSSGAASVALFVVVSSVCFSVSDMSFFSRVRTRSVPLLYSSHSVTGDL